MLCPCAGGRRAHTYPCSWDGPSGGQEAGTAPARLTPWRARAGNRPAPRMKPILLGLGVGGICSAWRAACRAESSSEAGGWAASASPGAAGSTSPAPSLQGTEWKKKAQGRREGLEAARGAQRRAPGSSPARSLGCSPQPGPRPGEEQRR